MEPPAGARLPAPPVSLGSPCRGVGREKGSWGGGVSAGDRSTCVGTLEDEKEGWMGKTDGAFRLRFRIK